MLIEKRKQNVNRSEYQTIYVKNESNVDETKKFAEAKSVLEFDSWFAKVEETRMASLKKSEKKIEEDVKELESKLKQIEELEWIVHQHVSVSFLLK